MNLLALQQSDINRSIVSAIRALGNTRHCESSYTGQDRKPVEFILISSSYRGRTQIRVKNKDTDSTTLITASPVFAESLLSTEVSIRISTSAPFRPAPADSETKALQGSVMDTPCDNGLFYQLHHALPAYLGQQLYRSGKHVVTVLQKTRSLESGDRALMEQLLAVRGTHASAHPRTENRSALIFVHADQRGQRKQLKQINPRYLSHPYHRLNVISKAALVLCDSIGIAADSIKSSVPASFITEPPKGYSSLQDCIERFLRHGSYARLLEEQQHELERLLRAQCHHEHVMNNQYTVDELIRDRLVYDHTRTQYQSLGKEYANKHSQNRLILCSQQSLPCKLDKSMIVASGLESGRRKYRKLRESPVRFMQDSQNRILRSLIFNKKAL